MRILAALALSACGLSGYERGFGATAPTDGTFGARAWAGMPRGKGRVWVTEMALIGHIDGFFAAAGGIGVRAPHGHTLRAEAAFGIGGRSFTGDIDGKNGLGPYVDGQLGAHMKRLARLTAGASALDPEAMQRVETEVFDMLL